MELDRLLEPRSIAVVGATDRPSAYGDIILRNLERLGFDGPIWGVNPRRDEHPRHPVLRLTRRPARSLPTRSRSPYPRRTCRRRSASAADAGCGGAVVISAGFGEIEGGRELERELRETALERAFPVCGPNGNGIVSFARNSAIWGDAVQPLPAGPVAMISQSGNVAVNALSSRRGINFHTVISTGNGAVCDPADWLFALCERDGVGSVAMFLESDGDGQKLAEALACCAERGIGVAVLKVGSSEAGAAAGRRAHRRARRRRADLPGADRGGGRVVGAQPARAARARPRPRRAARPAPWRRRPGDPHLLRRRLRDRRRRGGAARRRRCRRSRRTTKAKLRELLPDAATVANPLDYTLAHLG